MKTFAKQTLTNKMKWIDYGVIIKTEDGDLTKSDFFIK